MGEKLLGSLEAGYTSALNLDHAIAMRLVRSLDSFRFHGVNADIDSGTEDIWRGGGEYVWPDDDGEVMYVASTSTDDTLLGDGATGVAVFQMDGDGILEIIAYNLAGQTPVPIGTVSRVTRIIVIGNNANKGIITVGNGEFTTGTPVNKFAVIAIGSNINEAAIGTMPAGYSGLITGWETHIHGSTNSSAEVTLWVKDNGVFRVEDSVTLVQTSLPRYTEHFQFGIYLPPLADVKVTVVTTDNNMEISANIEVMSRSLTLLETEIFKG